ncbi:MAG TPA: hypothetical protein VFD43_12075 [Planctomycetota bacterium]|nr:hypothetical protein [Planctomycetota bacterium]
MTTSLTFTLCSLAFASGLLAIPDVRTAARPAGRLAAPVAAPGDHAVCEGKTIGFWGNPNGAVLIEAGDFLDVLPSLHLVDERGNPFATHDIEEFQDWLQQANAFNMAYMLSAQLAAMKFNVLAGFVDERECVLRTNTGELPVDRLIEEAIEALIEDPYTPPGDDHRRKQAELKNLLDAANNNLNWSA